MKEEIRSAITVGVLGGLVVFLFGGWSAALIGILVGILIGLSNGSRANPALGAGELARRSLPNAAISALVFVGMSLIEYFIVAPAAGKLPPGPGVIIG